VPTLLLDLVFIRTPLMVTCTKGGLVLLVVQYKQPSKRIWYQMSVKLEVVDGGLNQRTAATGTTTRCATIAIGRRANLVN
jgi:hypothetical protein